MTAKETLLLAHLECTTLSAGVWPESYPSRHPGIAIAVASTNLLQQDLMPAAVVLNILIAVLITIPYLLWLGREKPAPELAKPHL